jgi:prepilin-type processing-associated H-X9-DG protein
VGGAKVLLNFLFADFSVSGELGDWICLKTNTRNAILFAFHDGSIRTTERIKDPVAFREINGR